MDIWKIILVFILKVRNFRERTINLKKNIAALKRLRLFDHIY
jgi:hypothetical protein